MTVATKIGDTTVYNGDCLEVMATLAMLGVQVDSVVTDPPYHLTTVKRFATGAPALDPTYAQMSKGFMGKTWDGGDIAFQVDTWRRVYNLLKPGGHLLAFGGTRTYHRMACAIEDAGFEIRDMLGWLYGTGFPKSHDVSKDIDKRAGAEREVISAVTDRRGDGTVYGIGHSGRITSNTPATPDAQRWNGWGTALKPAQEPIVMARKPLIGTVAENVLAYGTGAINIDACRVGSDGGTKRSHTVPYGPGGRADQGGTQPWRTGHDIVELNKGRFPANVIHDGSDEVLEAFAAYGELKARGNKGDSLGKGANDEEVYAGGWKDLDCGARYNHEAPGTVGTAARFFYSAKASKADRAGSKHPTVKPVALIRYLATLVTPPGGVCLDPFAGSGTLGAAWPRCVLIEREPEYYADILRRLNECAA